MNIKFYAYKKRYGEIKKGGNLPVGFAFFHTVRSVPDGWKIWCEP